MASIIIPASKSLTVTNKFPNGNINEDTIMVGKDELYNYLSYLFFDISTIPSDVCVSYAELVLFKTDKFYDDDKKNFELLLLDDYFSTYTTYRNQPEINYNMRSEFYPLISQVAITIKVTSFVCLWLKNKYSNTSLVLCGRNKNSIVSFGSSVCKNAYLIPFLRVFYTPIKCNNPCCYNPDSHIKPTIKQIQVTGTVAPEGKYEAIVDLEITRKSGNKDNYYVTDEYDNSKGQLPLHIDKTYNIPIVPPKCPEDTENITFYGSYKI